VSNNDESTALFYAGSGRNMAYKFALIVLIPLAMMGCSSTDTSGYDGHKNISPDETNEALIMRSQYPDQYYGRENLTTDQRRELSEKMRADRLEARGRQDNSTDSGDGFGQSVPQGFYN